MISMRNKQQKNFIIAVMIGCAAGIAVSTGASALIGFGKVEACESVCGGEARWILDDEPHCGCIMVDHVYAPSK